jgi:CAAD domains of cyanobacterial aminoacyl-tRNA synthetase
MSFIQQKMFNKVQANLDSLQLFYLDNEKTVKNTGLTVGIFAAVIVSQFLLHGIVEVVDNIPVFNSIFELIGLFVTVRFAITNFSTKEQRDNFLSNSQNLYKEVIGN